MAKKFSSLRAKMSPEAQAKSTAKAEAMMAEMPLHELRRARRFSQKEIADHCKMQQANVSRLESQTDMYISTIRRFVEAMGGCLDVVARFPDGDVRISQFSGIGEDSEEVAS